MSVVKIAIGNFHCVDGCLWRKFQVCKGGPTAHLRNWWIRNEWWRRIWANFCQLENFLRRHPSVVMFRTRLSRGEGLQVKAGSPLASHPSIASDKQRSFPIWQSRRRPGSTERSEEGIFTGNRATGSLLKRPSSWLKHPASYSEIKYLLHNRLYQ